MPKKSTYNDYLKQEMSELIERIDLLELQKRCMKSRWLEQLLWLESRAVKSRNRHYGLRLLTIIGGVIVPALVSVNTAHGGNKRFVEVFGWTAFGLSQIVAISAAVEEFFHYGESYRRYRNSAEAMKIEGWQFFQLSGPYKGVKSHADAYATFAANVENIIQQDVEGYISQVTQSDEESKEKIREMIAQNLAEGNWQLKPQEQRPPATSAADRPDNSTVQSYQQSSQQVWYDEGGNQLVSSERTQSVSVVASQESGEPPTLRAGEEDSTGVKS